MSTAQTAPEGAQITWHYSRAEYIDGSQFVILTQDRIKVASLPKVAISNEASDLADAESTAAFIVTACNSHAALTASNAELRRALANMYRRATAASSAEFIEKDDQYREARAALGKEAK